MEKLFTLLELQRRAQEAPTLAAFTHITLNETHKLVPYPQAIFWRLQGSKIVLDKVSGNAVLDAKSPYALKVADEIKAHHSGPGHVIAVALPDRGSFGLIVKFTTQQDGTLGGLWLENAQAFNEAERQLLEELALGYGHALALLNLRASQSGWLRSWRHSRKGARILTAAMLLLAVLPVRFSVTAPAEITARDADIITVPFDGMIESIHVQPGDVIKKGQLLATMENSALDAQLGSAEQALRATESSLARLSRQSLASPDKKSDLTAAEAEIQNRRLQFEQAETMKLKSEIRASRDGIAVFSDANALEGRPLGTGEPIMTIADASEYDVMIRVPAEAMIPLSTEADVSVYLNVAPLSSYDATIKSIGYQASIDSDGLLTYKIHAAPQTDEPLRIGWKGTAKIREGWTVLSYAILRRPIAALRHLTGV